MNHFGEPNMDDYLTRPPSSEQSDGNGPWTNSEFPPFLHQPPRQQYNEGGNFNSNSLGAIYVSNIPLISHPPPQQPAQQFDENGMPIKIRKKPGRKPNPASPALRKAQNRAAQRAFRERKERHLKDLEGTIRQLREQRNSAIKELNQTKGKMDSFRAENWYLKGVVLTLQFVCLHHNIHIPTHSPYLTEEALSDMAKTTPHAIEAYVNAYTRNNINLKPTMAAHFANAPDDKESPIQQEEEEEEEEEEEADRDEEMLIDEPDGLSPEPPYVKIEDGEDEEDESMTKWVKQHNENKKKRKEQPEEEEAKETRPDPSSISAIQRIRLQLRVQSAISNAGKSAVRLQPTILQLAIPHDPRIDLIPTPHMRDRMIIFRDQMDYDRCFAMLLNGALYHGGDPTMSASWELPAEFFSEFWYLAINYDVNRTNTWRRLKGLPDIRGGLNIAEDEWDESSVFNRHHETPASTSSDTVWTDDVFAQMTAGMPTLQPIDSHHLTSGFDFGSPTADYQHHQQLDPSTHPLFEQLMGSPPSSRHNRSPSIGNYHETEHLL